MLSKQRGMATLLVSVILIFSLSVAALYMNRGLFIEQKSNNNAYYNAQARNAAVSGMQVFLANFRSQISTPDSITWLDATNNYAPITSVSLPQANSDIDYSSLNRAHTDSLDSDGNPKLVSSCTAATGTAKSAVLCGRNTASSQYFIGVNLLSSSTTGGVTTHNLRVASIGQADGNSAESVIFRDIQYIVTPGTGSSNLGSFFAVNGSYRYYNSSIGVDIGVCTVGCGLPPASEVPSGVNQYDQYNLIKGNYSDFASNPHNGISVGDKIQSGTPNWSNGSMSWTDQTPAGAKSNNCTGLYYSNPDKSSCSNNNPASIAGKQANDQFFKQYFGANKDAFLNSNFSNISSTNKSATLSADGSTVVINCRTGCTYTSNEIEAALKTYTDKSVIIDGNVTISGGTSDMRQLQDTFLYVSGELTLGNWATGAGPTMTFNGVLAVEGNVNAYTSFNLNPSYNAYQRSRARRPPAAPTVAFTGASGWRDFKQAN
ncbi:hypothetical protein [Chitinibacter tainanensis]|uniref:hypothetical protein n=1 Tax=Chitinibacter tainanensis TaxID=230667 RepID=UPI000424D7E7|nr:hypothetical protein [Chitinibacter tainanensis]